MLMHGRDYPQQRITTLSSIYLLHLLGAELLLWSEDGVTAGVVAAPPAPAVRVQRGRAQAAQVVAAHLTRQQLLQHRGKYSFFKEEKARTGKTSTIFRRQLLTSQTLSSSHGLLASAW